jgi:hypothetical protein
MGNLDRQLQEMGYVFRDGHWCAPDEVAQISRTTAADALHALLVARADALMSCTEGSAEEGELEAITDAIEAYESVHEPGLVDLPHPALGQDLTLSATARRAQAGTGVRARSARKGAGVDKSRSCVA